MNLYRRLVRFLARNELAALTVTLSQEHVQRAWDAGYALGQAHGQARAIDAVYHAVRERKGFEIEAEDVERAGRGLVH
jgi:hypothetical protein